MAKEEKNPEDDLKLIDNLEIHKNENYVIVFVNPKIFPLEILYAAGYVFLDRAYVVLDGDPDKELEVYLRSKKKKIDLEILGRDFNNELISYSAYKVQSEFNKDITEEVVKKSLDTNSQEVFMEDDSEDYLDDPLEIAVPWEEKNKKKEDKDSKKKNE